MKKNIFFFFLLIMLLPINVYAEDLSTNTPLDSLIIIITIILLIFFCIVPTILISLFVFKKISNICETDPAMQKKLFWKMFWSRILILFIIFSFTGIPVLIIDFLTFIIGGFIIPPILTSKKNTQSNSEQSVVNSEPVQNLANINNNQVTKESKENIEPVLPSSFDYIYTYNEEKILEILISDELKKANIKKDINLFPLDAIKRKNIMTLILVFLIFIFASMIFFHFPIFSYIIGLIVLIIIYKLSNKFDLIAYLKKQVKARPSEKISNIVMNSTRTLANDNSKKIIIIGSSLALVLALFIFRNPMIMYEKMDGGYGVRFYTFGLTNFTSATIPETYKGEKVISLRGNTFSNMFFLKEINLPDTVTEIRGQAFKNLLFLEEIKLPSKLEYLGGGAFYNCRKLKSIEIPDTVTYLGGESFYNARSLEYVKLSNNLSEIRGDSFEYCTSLKSITIPDNVTRIGGHAFYGDTSLSEVLISENSKLSEIGSSAFRQCSSLYNITIPYGTYVNERAFKESPTTVNRYSSFYNGYNSSNQSESNNINTLNENSEISVNQTVNFMQANIKVSLISLNDSRTNKSTDSDLDTGNVVGKLRIVTNDNQYYYDFDLKNGSYYYIFENYVIKIFPGTRTNDNYVDCISVSLYNIQDFNPNFKFDVENYFQIGDILSIVGSKKISNGFLLSLDNISINGSNVEYTLTFSGYVNRTIKLNNTNNMSYKVDDNLMIKIISVDQDKGIIIKVYYN